MKEPTRDRILSAGDDLTARPARRPDWIRMVKIPQDRIQPLRSLIRAGLLNTVCEEALCPNLGECWGRGTATFLLLGNICTRSCGFCDVKRGRPEPLDPGEPERVLQAVQTMQLRHAVITSVNRDDLPDGGAAVFAEVIRRIRETTPGCTIEVLIPDFKGRRGALETVVAAQPDILNHNVETVPRLFQKVQPQDRFEWARATLTGAKELRPGQVTKSGIMVGLGETYAEVVAVMREIRSWGVDILTVGQYLQPSRRHLPVERYYNPEEFFALKETGLTEIGFRWVESAPLVRSSYRADEQARALNGMAVGGG